MNKVAGVNALGHGWRNHPNGNVKYIGKPNGLPGKEGVDWGWTDKASESMELSLYWQRRFKSDMRKCGYIVK